MHNLIIDENAKYVNGFKVINSAKQMYCPDLYSFKNGKYCPVRIGNRCKQLCGPPFEMVDGKIEVVDTEF
jgi:hypothetical protein